MRLSQRLEDERAYVQRTCVGEICARCGATLQTYSDKCSAPLDERCPGFETIEAAKKTFNENYPR